MDRLWEGPIQEQQLFQDLGYQDDPAGSSIAFHLRETV